MIYFTGKHEPWFFGIWHTLVHVGVESDLLLLTIYMVYGNVMLVLSGCLNAVNL